MHLVRIPRWWVKALVWEWGLGIASIPASPQEEEMKTLFAMSDFPALPGGPEGWQAEAYHDGIRPEFAVDPAVGRTAPGSLRIAARGNPAAFGNFRYRVPGIIAGKWYRLTVYYRLQHVPSPRRSVFARLVWVDAEGTRQHYKDLLWRTEPDGEWVRLWGTFQAPEKAVGVDIELFLAWAAQGTVWWDDLTLEEVPRPPERLVRVATVFHRPRETRAPEKSVAEFCQKVAEAAVYHPDIVCLPEGITVIGTGKSYCEVAEPIPGPTTARLGEVARQYGCYLVAGLYEQDGNVFYNTAVLLDRQGKLVGKYRKTHLPNEEFTEGLTPGDEYPVFQTDFGTVGMMICWDVQFPEPARALAAKGAEMIFLPIWGGNEILARARAIENHLTLVTSSYDMKTAIINPQGDFLGVATPEQPVVCCEVNLDEKIIQEWIGDMKGRTIRERRTELRVPELEN